MERVPLTNVQIRVLMALLLLSKEIKHPRYADIRAVTGHSKSTIHDAMHQLRNLGFVAFEPELRGTLRPLVMFEKLDTDPKV